VIALDEDLRSLEPSNPVEIRHGGFESRRPTCVSGYDEKIFFGPDPLPRGDYPGFVIAPFIAEAVHRLVGPAGEMEIPDCENSHLLQSAPQPHPGRILSEALPGGEKDIRRLDHLPI
jgi:hypothetical protein